MKKIIENISPFWLFLLLCQFIVQTQLKAQKDITGISYTNDPLVLKEEVTYNPATNNYTVVKKVGNEIVGTEIKSFDQYWDERYKASEEKYFKEKVENEGFDKSKPLLPTMKIPGKDASIFGSNKVEIKPTGSAELIFGVMSSTIKNPALPVRSQRNSNFQFNQNIQLNIVGTIGDKLKLTTNYNTQSTFDFENQMKLEFTGSEDDIIKKIELGNVSLPLQTQLIQGSQTLFGVKTELQFGKLSVAAIATQQKGESKSVETQGGSQIRDFKIQADQYESNRHFFLAHYFADRYDTALANLPFVNSPVQITRVEVWMTNVGNNNNEDSRNIVGLIDIGEKNPHDNTLLVQPSYYPENNVNNLFKDAVTSADIRNFTNADGKLLSWGYQDGEQYNKIENARKLKPEEFTFNPQLGYISLNRSLNADEILAVAFQYTVIGQTQVYQVGEFSTDGATGKQALILKMLKGNKVNNTHIPTWDLMMKNVYSLGESGIKQETFQMQILYTDAASNNDINFINEGVNKATRWIELLGADQINIQQDRISDGFYDFIEGVTIKAQNGRIYFPVRQPFGSYLRNKLSDVSVANRYCFDSLYTVTPIAAQTKFPAKNRFKFWVKFETSSSNVISLNATNVPQGSVVVTAGGKTLVENQDYTVNYMMGQVTIINEGILNSSTPVKVALESNSLFNIQTKNLLGANLNYRVSKDFNIGGTILNLTERPLNFKVNLGDEPMSNTIWGLNTKYHSELPLLTKLIDKLPLLSTKETSIIDFNGEFAQLIPGTSSAIANGESGQGESYIDNFEGAETNTSLTVRTSWFLASTPRGRPELFPEGNLTNSLAVGFNRANLTWYSIDNLFIDNSSNTPQYLQNDAAQQNNNFIRPINQTEVFPKKQGQNGINPNITTLDLAFYPSERGQYNFDTTASPYSSGVDKFGQLKNPETRWGGIMRKIETVDFEASNIEFLEFWMMDPFYDGVQNDYSIYGGSKEGGDLYVHIGNLSEDVLSDSRKSFENGLPTNANDISGVDKTVWGYVPNSLNIVNAFNNDPAAREFQDVGLDGLTDDNEKTFYQNYLDFYSKNFGSVPSDIQQDPSADNFVHFRDENFDNSNEMVLNRYKYFNGTSGNSPVDENSTYIKSATTIPDIEDINRDNTMGEGESYYEYHISMRPQDLEVADQLAGTNYINNIYVPNPVASINNYDKSPEARWIHFRIPIREPEKAIGGIQDFRSMRFIRIMMKGWQDPVVLRFARMDLVRETWRKYESQMKGDCEFVASDDNTKFVVTSINVEEDSQKEPIPYIAPVERVNNLQTQSLMNEQALFLNIDNLDGCDSRAAFYNTNVDLRSYGCLKMFVHAETKGDPSENYDGKMSVFLRLGSDFDDNYYEYEIPLKFTDPSSVSTNNTEAAKQAIWPDENLFDFDFSVLTNAKLARNESMETDPENYFKNQRYKVIDGKNNVYVKGSPTLSQVKIMMIGVRNSGTSGEIRSAGVWVNELRLSCFDQQNGWAATATSTLKMADFGSVTLSGKMYTPGWGNITDKVSQRKRDYLNSYDAAANFELGKLIPAKYNVTVPVYLGYSESFQNQEFNPLDQDIRIKDIADADLRKKVRDSTQTYQRRRSMNFSNVRKNRSADRKKKAMPYDIENFDATYAFNEVFKSDVNTSYNVVQTYKGALNYNFTHQPKNFQPFINSPIIGFVKKTRLETYEEREQKLQQEIERLRKEKSNPADLKKAEEELKKVKDDKASFAKRASSLMQTPYLKLTREFNFFLVPSRVGVRNDLNRMYSESMIRNNSGAILLIDPVFNKNFYWDRAYDVSWDLSKSLKFKYGATNRARIDEPEGRIDVEEKVDSVITNLKQLGRNTNFTQTWDVNYDIPFRKIPFTDWITGTVKYTAKMDWQAAPLAFQSVGNTISNSNSKQLNLQFNLVNFYNKSAYLKKINNNVSKPPKVSSDTSKKEKAPSLDLAQVGLRMMMMVRNASFTYTETNGTFLPGYDAETEMLGLNLDQMSPGFKFITGQQQDNILEKAAKAGWLTRNSDSLNTKFTRNYTNNMNAKATLEPIKKMRIELTASRSYNRDSAFNYRLDENNDVTTFTNTVMQSYSITVLTIGSAFETKSDATSAVYEQFKSNRAVVASRLAAKNPYSSNTQQADGFYKGYGRTQGEVLLQSFVAAYTGKNAASSDLSLFKKLPMPNWRLNYDGFMQIALIKKHFQSFTMSHAYSCTMSQSVTQNFAFISDGKGFTSVTNPAGFEPQYTINTVNISESLSPLIKIDATLKSSWIAKLEIKKTRTISLNLQGLSVSEMSNFTIAAGTGYKFKDVKLPFEILGKKVKSNLDLRADLSITNSKNVVHKIDGSDNIMNGANILMLKTSADYVLSDKLNIRLFYDFTLNKPVTSNSFPSSNGNGGLSLRYTL